MLEINVKDCKDCGDIQNLLDKLDNKLFRMANDEYNHLVYLSDKNHTKAEIKTIIRYKRILDNIFWNSQYYDRDYKNILSKIKSIV